MRKTRIEVRTDLAARADTCEAARLEVENGHDDLSDVADNDGEAEIDSPNVGLLEFDIQTQKSLADSVRETRRKWAIDDLIEGRHNKLIMSLIMNIRAEISTHMEDSLTIRRGQVDEFDCPSTVDIDQVSTNVVVSWQEIICSDSQPVAINVDMEDDKFKSNSSGHHGAATGFLELLMDEIEILDELLTKVEYNSLSKNLEVIILYDIIQDRLPLNHLQRVVVKEVLNHPILNKEN